MINEVSMSSCLFTHTPGADTGVLANVDMFLAGGVNWMELSPGSVGTDKEMDALEKSGIKIWSVHGVMGLDVISPDPAVREAEVERAYQHALKCARFAPCPLVEHYLNRHSDPEVGKRFRDSVEKLYEKVSRLGYILCIETAPYKPLQYDRHPYSSEIAEFVRSFGKDDLQMTVDINHSNLAEDLVETAKNTRGLVKNVHISNNYGKIEDHNPPQDGVIDIKRAFDALRENGYTGPCNLEFRFPGADTIPTVELIRDVRQYVEKLLWDK